MTRTGSFIAVAICAALGCGAPFPIQANQPDYIADETTPVDSATKLVGPLARIFQRDQYGKRMPVLFRDRLSELPPFWRDMRLNLRSRVYHFDRARDDAADQESTASGFALAFRSGNWREFISLGLTGYTTQRIHGRRDAAGIGLLKPVQNGFSVLGEAYVSVRLPSDIMLTLYRKALNLPYFNRQDSRMVPNTYESYLIYKRDSERLQWVGGHITKQKRRDADRFVPLSEAAGYPGTDDGVSVAGFRWHVDGQTNVGVINYQAWNVMNITYAEARTLFQMSDEIPVAVSAQFSYQRDTGNAYGGDFGTYTAGVRMSASYRRAVFSFAGTYTDEDAAIQSPFGGRPAYLSLMIADFDRAGEQAWMAAASYDFGRFGLDGFAVSLKFAQGYGHGADPDRDELDVTVDYRPVAGFLRGVWLRARYATLDQSGGGDRHDVRFIVNYEIPLL